MILTDTGPLIALLDRDDVHHARSVAAAERLPAAPLATTWPCFTEAMYLLGTIGGYRLQRGLWQLRATGSLILLDLTTKETDRMSALMEKYRETPMDLADASIVTIAESRALQPIFTFDSDFYIYRLKNGNALSLVP
jgi:predicted nucleic acid-binding protein